MVEALKTHARVCAYDRAGHGRSDEASYVCGSCGEEIVVPLDPSAGEHQQYVEDCPVCCVPNEVFVDYDEDAWFMEAMTPTLDEAARSRPADEREAA